MRSWGTFVRSLCEQHATCHLFSTSVVQMLGRRVLQVQSGCFLQKHHELQTLLRCPSVRNPRTMASQVTSSSTAQQLNQNVDHDIDPIVQWVVLRRDLWTDKGWPLGPVIAQACHASSAAMFLHINDAITQEYIAASNIDHMHKVVLEVKSEQQLVNLSSKLQQEGIQHKLWVEQPENYPTCLATKPYRRSQAAPLFKKLQLCKAQLAQKS